MKEQGRAELEEKKREAYAEKVQAQLKKWEAEIAELRAKADMVRADAKVTYHEQIGRLQKEQESIRARLEEMNLTGRDAWKDLKLGIDEAVRDLKEAFKLARGRFKKD